MKKWLSVFFILATISLSAQEKIYAPALTAPADGAVNQVVNVLLDWNPVAGAVSYQVNLDTSSVFSNPQIAVATYSAWQASLLLFNTEYSWRVRAIAAPGDTSAWSAVRTFTVVSKPTLSKPSDNAITVPVSPSMSWLAMSGVVGYQAQFDSVNTFDSPFLKSQFFTGSYEMKTKDNYYGDQYFWRVRAINGLDTSNWSDIRTFFTRDSIALLSPSDGLNSKAFLEQRVTSLLSIPMQVFQHHIISIGIVLQYVFLVAIPQPAVLWIQSHLACSIGKFVSITMLTQASGARFVHLLLSKKLQCFHLPIMQ
jgi:hypothetical protein